MLVVRIALLFVALFILAPLAWPQTSTPTEARYPISQSEFKNSLQEIEQLLNKGAWLEAKTRYQTLIQYDLSETDRQTVRKALDNLNIKILFSPIPTSDSISYTVQRGDSLYEIAKKYNTTVELIQKTNHLSGDLIRPDLRLKISNAKYSVLVSKSRNELELYANNELIKTYPVATGKGGLTPIGTFTIVTKLENPVWYKAGAVFPPDSPDNILGTRWMGFSLESYGIHGTTLPETIGTNATEGCVRMYNQDVEELFAVVPMGTAVTIVE